MTTTTTRKYNLKLQRLNPRDLKLEPKNERALLKLPTIVDLRKKLPEVYDQGNLGSCTANALCSAVAYNLKLNGKYFLGSRLFLYYNERKIEGTISEDSGAYLSDGVIALNKYGICKETSWPYTISKFTVNPGTKLYMEARTHRAISYKNITQTLVAMQQSLAMGIPFVIGIAIYSSFENDTVSKTGIVSMPKVNTESLLGGHALMCVGYDNNKKVWIVRNSWGSSWGDKGYCYIPYAYFLDFNLSTDIWAITKMS